MNVLTWLYRKDESKKIEIYSSSFYIDFKSDIPVYYVDDDRFYFYKLSVNFKVDIAATSPGGSTIRLLLHGGSAPGGSEPFSPRELH